jgi:hypothetical protein
MAAAGGSHMRKTVGFFFVSLMLAAGSAHAQGTFLEDGFSGTGMTVGAGTIKNGWTASFTPSYTYRGAFDVGLDASRITYTGGDAKNLWALGLTPFARAYLNRAENGNLPVSIAADVAVQKRIYFGNGGGPNPDGWGILAGGAIFRRVEFTDGVTGIPEIDVAYTMSAITWHSASADQNAAVRSKGQATEYSQTVRAALRLNMAVRRGDLLYTASPYFLYENGANIGLNAGLVF